MHVRSYRNSAICAEFVLSRLNCGLPHLQAFVGVSAICAICAVPLLRKEQPKPGHGLFDSEKPQEVELAQEAQRREKLNIGGRIN